MNNSNRPNICANGTLDAMCCVCGAHCATWIGENEQGDREYTLDCLGKDRQRAVEQAVLACLKVASAPTIRARAS